MKDTAISINKYISSILKGNEELMKKVHSNIYPLIANQDTTFPFIIHQRDAVIANYTKDGRSNDSASFTITIRSKSYADSIELTEIIRGLFERRHDNYFKLVQLSSVTEEYNGNDDSFTQRITFVATI